MGIKMSITGKKVTCPKCKNEKVSEYEITFTGWCIPCTLENIKRMKQPTPLEKLVKRLNDENSTD